MKNRIINVQNVPISISKQELDDYICITDIAKAKTGESRSADVVKNWLRNRNTLEFLGTWEMIYNPDFKVVEFDHFKSEAGLHTFVLSVAEWKMCIRDRAITRGLGGKKNISDVDCCATRLRCTIHDASRVNDSILKATGASGVVHKGNGVQVIYGPNVTVIKSNLEDYLEKAPDTYAETEEAGETKQEETKNTETEKKVDVYKRQDKTCIRDVQHAM